MTTDQVCIGVREDGRVRYRVAVTTEAVREAVRRHGTGRLATCALGRALTCAALFPLEHGKLDVVSLQLTGGGPLQSVFAEVRFPGFVRGYVGNPDAVPRAPIAFERAGAGLGLLPGGMLGVVRQNAAGGYSTGQVELTNGEIDEDLEEYFNSSDQAASRVFAHVELDDDGEVVSAYGVLVQVVPPGTAADLASFTAPAALPSDLETAGAAAAGGPVRELERAPVVFRCGCSRERVLAGLALVEEAELVDMIETDRGAEVDCRFCAEHYAIEEDDLRALLEQRRGLLSSEGEA